MIDRTLTIERAATKHVVPEYYDALATIEHPHHFPSPVNDPEWLKSTVNWFVESTVAMEVGPGRGEFAEAVIKSGGLERYYIIDMSKGMLDLVKARLQKLNSKTELIFIHADVDRVDISQIPDGSLDKIIMVNAFQDINPSIALGEFRRILKPGGLFRANVISREIREQNSRDDEFFDKAKGLFYLTRHPAIDEKEKITPIGYITKNSGEKMPYYRMLRSYYRSELDMLFKDSGFEIVSETPIILPKNVWMNSAAAQGRGHDPKRQEHIDKIGGHPGSIDFIARSLTYTQN